MELLPILNEPAIVGTALVLLAVHVLAQSLGWLVPKTPVLTPARRQLWILGGVYVLFSLAVGLIVYAVYALSAPLIVTVAVGYLLLTFSSVQQWAGGALSTRQLMGALGWAAVCLSVAVLLIWWWPW